MSTTNLDHQIVHYQGDTFVLEFDYVSETNTGVGGISLNYEGISGSVYISIDATTVSNIPAGRHFYDLAITGNDKNGITGADGETTNILSGTFELAREVTR